MSSATGKGSSVVVLLGEKVVAAMKASPIAISGRGTAAACLSGDGGGGGNDCLGGIMLYL